ncbi:3-keto-5-aminohexanoate cleavage protein [Streptantibioticus rubrisoli]|uniref:3-keto-5-aminohexanoate cleavage protein n=1 Tax=Streptantibioticus rubrisoli TaxID=1387313 RepID=A0ABT1P902_9ACTN|nr:3-keto-5-aminohexanoate cleavage protein [Streptantibioticus rubrisoli]MCQ4041846.1 3-keto-5-aminohexanoate cleavage protein [Streptantibioticus rubrisoli]
MNPADKLIVNLCPTGMVPRRSKVPAVPLTPEEIAADVRRCREAGASMVHLHARDDDEEPTWRPERFQQICQAVVAEVPDIVVVVTTSGRNWSELDKRAASLTVSGPGRPEMASLTLGSMNFPTGPSINSPQTIEGLAEAMREREIVPELEVFDVGMANYACFLADKGILRPPFYANVLLGSRGTADLSAANVAAVLAGLPEGTTWSLAGIGRFQTRANTLAAALGGHIRVGLEDNPYYDWRDKSDATNPRLVERAVRIAREMGREPSTPAQTRAIIGLKPVDRA